MELKSNKQHQQKNTAYAAVILVALITGLAITGCGKKVDAQAGNGMTAMPVSVITLEATTVPISAEAVAQTEGASEVEIRPRVGGILLKRLYQEGAAVKAGQPMFLIDPVPYQIALTQAKAQLAQQQARIEQTKREAARLKGLLDTQSVSEREYDNAVSDNNTAVATVQQAEAAVREAELNLSYTKVTAPSSGMSGRFQFSEGALVAPNTSLLTTIVQLSPIWVRFSFSDNEIAQLGGQLNQHSVKKVNLILPDGSEYKQKGELNFAASQVDPTLGTQQFRAAFDNADKAFMPGQFARVRVTTGSREGVFLVPQTSVLTGDQGKFVFVADKDKEGKTVASVRPIQEGGWQGTNWVILSGLKTGDQVIIDNLIKVRPGAPIAPHPSEAPPPSPAAEASNSADSKQATK